MKSLIALIALLPVMSFASTCYEAESATPFGVPEKLCLNSITETPYDRLLKVESADGSFPALLNVDSYSRHNEDRLRFQASATLIDIYESGCGSAIKAKLIVKGEFTTGDVHTDYLDITVDAETTNDTCHSRPSKETITYKLVK